jgi:hypothetical protein
MDGQIKGQMNIEDFIPLPQSLIDQLEPELKKAGRAFAEGYKHGIEHRDPGYLGKVDKSYAEAIRGEQIKNFHDLRDYVGRCMLLSSSAWINKDGKRVCHTTWIIVQIMEYDMDGDEAVDDDGDFIAAVDRVKCRDSYNGKAPAFWVSELRTTGGADFGYKKLETFYEIKAKSKYVKNTED